MKRIISLLLIVSLTMGCFTGCSDKLSGILDGINKGFKSKTSAGSKDTSVSEDMAKKYGLTDEFSEKMQATVILKKDMELAFVNGFTEEVSQAPFEYEKSIYIPCGFVTKSLGGSAKKDGTNQKWKIGLNEEKWSIDLKNKTAKTGETEIKINKSLINSENDFMISTTDYSAITGLDAFVKDDTIFVGKDVGDTVMNLPEEGDKLINGVINSHLVADNIGKSSVSTKNDFDRLEISKILDIDPADVPFKVQKEKLVASSGNLYIEDLSIKHHPTKKNYCICDMTVYNTGMTYAIVESFTNDDKMVDDSFVEPYGGRYESVLKSLANTAIIINGTIKSIATQDVSEILYRSSAISGSTKVSLEVPLDGYIFITSNPDYSDKLAVCDALSFTAQLYLASSSIISLNIEDASATMRDLIVESAINTIGNNSVSMAQIAGSFRDFIKTKKEHSPLNCIGYVNESVESFSQVMENCEFDMEKLLDQSVDLAAKGLSETIDVSIKKILSLCPDVGWAFNIMDFISDIENFACIITEYETAYLRKPLVIKFADWRTAYARLLRKREFKGSEHAEARFGLSYVDKNNIPELIIMDCQSQRSRAHVFTFKDYKVEGIEGETIPTPYGYFLYNEFGDVTLAGFLQHGHETLVYRNVLGANKIIYSFYNDCMVTGDESKATYKVDDKAVSKEYYDYMISVAKKEYGVYEEKKLDYEQCYPITEENIKKKIESR